MCDLILKHLFSRDNIAYDCHMHLNTYSQLLTSSRTILFLVSGQ